ncbi:MAG: bem46 [Chlamydiia bacterium]|nr:bem46 [Chlamydiia bacterium]
MSDGFDAIPDINKEQAHPLPPLNKIKLSPAQKKANDLYNKAAELKSEKSHTPTPTSPVTSSTTTTSSPTNSVSKKVSKLVVPALSITLTDTEKGKRVSPKEPSSPLQAMIKPYLNVCTSGKADNFYYHSFAFNSKSHEHTVVVIPCDTAFDQTVADIIEKYREEKKNLVIVKEPLATFKANESISHKKREAITQSLQYAVPKFKEDTFTFKPQYADTNLLQAPFSLFRRACEIDHLGGVSEVNIASQDGSILNGIEIRPTQLFEKPEKQKWIIYYQKNAATWEQGRNFLAKMAQDTGANVLSCNYRGVGLSTGFPETADALVQDGEATLQHLLSQGVLPENILLYGTSLGGGVATQVAAIHAEQNEQIALCNERSFSSLSSAIEKIVPLVGKFTATFATSHGWELDSKSKLALLREKQVPIIVIYSPGDRLVKPTAAFQKAVLEQRTKEITASPKLSKKTAPQKREIIKIRLEETAEENAAIKKMGLQDQIEYAHNRPLSETEWQKFVAAAKDVLHIPTK